VLDILLEINNLINMNTPENLKYTKDHEWISVVGNNATVGITHFAQSELGDIVYVDIDTIGETLKQDDVFGTVEAVKTVSDLLLPVDGEIIEFNNKLEDQPELVNSDPYGKGWLVKLKIQNQRQVELLLDAKDYKAFING